jgi:hypothetical protein
MKIQKFVGANELRKFLLADASVFALASSALAALLAATPVLAQSSAITTPQATANVVGPSFPDLMSDQPTAPAQTSTVPAAQDIVPPEIVQLDTSQTEGDIKKVHVDNTNNHYVLYCNVKAFACITPNEGKDYYLITKDTHWKIPGAKDFLSLSLLQDYTVKYNKGENVALLEKDPDPTDHNNVGMFLIDRADDGEGPQFGSANRKAKSARLLPSICAANNICTSHSYMND